jgi:hypothetical protein
LYDLHGYFRPSRRDLETVGTNHPVTWCHSPYEERTQEHFNENAARSENRYVETSTNENHKAKFDDAQNVWSSLQTELLLEAFLFKYDTLRRKPTTVEHVVTI